MPQLFESIEGKPLEDFLTVKMKRKLNTLRYFYIVSANLDNHDRGAVKLLKFGEGGGAGEHRSSGAKRLQDYLIMYGRHTYTNRCLGVKIHYLFTTKYSPNVVKARTQILKAETQLKAQIKNTPAVANDRGTERLFATVPDLIKMVRAALKGRMDEISHNPHNTRARARHMKNRLRSMD